MNHNQPANVSSGRPPSLVARVGSAIWRATSGLRRTGAHRYVRFLLFCIVFDAFVRWINFKYDEVGDKAYLYPILIVHTTIPFLAVWSLWKVATLAPPNDTDAQDGMGFTDPIGQDAAPLEVLLLGVERSIQQALLDGERNAARLEKYGRSFAMFSTLIPLITWVYALVVAHNKDKLDNLWALTFSSTGAGSLGVTIGVTLLRHAKAARARLETLSEEILVLRKMRVVCLATFDEESKTRLTTALGARLAAAGRSSAAGAGDTPEEHGTSALEAILRVLPSAKGS